MLRMRKGDRPVIQVLHAVRNTNERGRGGWRWSHARSHGTHNARSDAGAGNFRRRYPDASADPAPTCLGGSTHRDRALRGVRKVGSGRTELLPDVRQVGSLLAVFPIYRLTEQGQMRLMRKGRAGRPQLLPYVWETGALCSGRRAASTADSRADSGNDGSPCEGTRARLGAMPVLRTGDQAGPDVLPLLRPTSSGEASFPLAGRNADVQVHGVRQGSEERDEVLPILRPPEPGTHRLGGSGRAIRDRQMPVVRQDHPPRVEVLPLLRKVTRLGGRQPGEVGPSASDRQIHHN